MRSVSTVVESPVDYDFLRYCDQNFAKSESHILNSCFMVALTDVKALQ
jgi:hypothetical protein